MGRGVLSQVPGLGGYLEAQQIGVNNQSEQLKQVAVLQGILSRQQAQQEEQELKGVLSQTGGDPAKAIQALVSTGNPRGLELAAKLKAMIPPPPSAYTLAPGAQRRGPNNELLAEAPMREPRPQNPSNLSRLMEERDKLPEGDPRRVAFDNAIRKESETARQITPPIVINNSKGKAPAGYRFSADGETLEPIPGGPKDTSKARPLPTQALRLQNDQLDAIGIAGSISADLDAVQKQIEGGKLDLGLLKNFISKGRNTLGVSNENSKNFNSFMTTLERLRNDSLRLNKGVQTEGDAQRAWNELMGSINDKEVVKQRLIEIKAINERAINLRKMNVDQIRSNYGQEPLDTSGYSRQAPAVGAASNPVDALLEKYK